MNFGLLRHHNANFSAVSSSTCINFQNGEYCVQSKHHKAETQFEHIKRFLILNQPSKVQAAIPLVLHTLFAHSFQSSSRDSGHTASSFTRTRTSSNLDLACFLACRGVAWRIEHSKPYLIWSIINLSMHQSEHEIWHKSSCVA